MERLLFITADNSVIDTESTAYRRVMDLREKFSEIHIILIRSRLSKRKDDVVRLHPNVWVYSLTRRLLLGVVRGGISIVRDHLFFGENFRIDYIVADDVYRAGLLGFVLGKKFNAPFQLRIPSGSPNLLKEGSFFETWCGHMVLKRTKSISVSNEHEQKILMEKYDVPQSCIEVLKGSSVLRFYGNDGFTSGLRERYETYSHMLLLVSEKGGHSIAHVLRGLVPLLKEDSRLGLLVLEDGPGRLSLERLAISLGIQKQVLFEPVQESMRSYITMADALLYFAGDNDDRDPLLLAGVSKTPIITAPYGVGAEMFVDKESAYFCAPDAVENLRSVVSTCVYGNEKEKLVESAYVVVQDYLKGDYRAYLDACAKSITTCTVD